MRKSFFLVALTVLSILLLAISLSACKEDPPSTNDGDTTVQESGDNGDNGDTAAPEESGHKHRWGEWLSITSPTCTTRGARMHICACGQSETEYVPALGHAPSEWRSGYDSYHYQVCANEGCEEALNGAYHTPATTWAGDYSGHWHPCKQEGCTVGFDRASHTYDAENTCQVCAYYKDSGVTFTLQSDNTYAVTDYTDWSYYSNNVIIPSVYKGLPVTHVADYAFSRHENLESITLPSSITSMGGGVFSGCPNLKSVTLPSGITSIGYAMFSCCTGLTDIVIPDAVTSIGEGAFYGCTSLVSITIPAGVEQIDLYAFRDCLALSTITVADENKTYHSAGNCLIETSSKTLVLGIKTSVIPTDGSVTSIGESAFDYCTGLTSITIPASVTSIGDYAFYGCPDLTSITIPASVTSIGEEAFARCGLESITFAENSRLTSISPRAFYECNDLTAVYIADIAAWCGVTMANFESNPLYYTKNLYVDGAKITTLEIPAGVKSIAKGAFFGCTSLTSVVVSADVTEIGYLAFGRCSNLTSITVASGNRALRSEGNCLIATTTKTLILGLPDCVIPTDGSVTAIGAGAFYAHTDLTSITLPKGVTSIGNLAFYGCSGLTSITLPAEVVSIGNNAFRDCTALASIEIPARVASIGIQAFYNCSALTSITIPASVTSIDHGAFWYCTGLTSVTFDANIRLKTLAYHAFGECSNLTYITIPASVTGIDEGAFAGCSSLSFITIPAGVTSIGDSAFYGCSGLTSITIPASVTSIGESAFYACKNLTSVTVKSGNRVYHSAGNCLIETASKTLILGCKNSTIPSDGSVTAIGDYAFAYRSLTSIRIPACITRIGEYAFYGCDNLVSAIFENGNGWQRVYDNDDTYAITASDLADPAVAAKYLKESYNTYWERT